MMKVSLVQMEMELFSPDHNYALAEKLVEEAAAAGPDVIVLPETWNTGFFPCAEVGQYADHDGRTLSLFKTLAKRHHVNIITGSVTLREGDAVKNRTFIIDREGNQVAAYDKTHLFSRMGEDVHYEKGTEMVDFELDGIRCGVVTCYDIRFPELIRTLGLRGIQVLFVSAQWPVARLDHWQILNRARAIENQIYVVCVNSAGRANDVQYAGHSAVIDPWGRVLLEADGGPAILTHELDLGLIQEIRATLHVYRDRRADLY